MWHEINGARIHFAEYGTGIPLLALHGSGVDHREIEAAVEAVVPAGYRRIYPDLPGDGFDEYFVVRTAATARRYRDHVAPGTSLVDEQALGRIFARWRIDLGPDTVLIPTLIAAGRRDSVAGYADAVTLLARYPRACLAVAEDAGHALMHERPELFKALIHDWLRRAASGDHRAAARDSDRR